MMTLDEIEAKIDEAIRNDESYDCEYWKGYRDATKRNIPKCCPNCGAWMDEEKTNEKTD